MSTVVDWLSAQLASNPLAVAAVVMLFALCQGILVVGRYVPGGIVLMAISAAAGAAGQGLWTVFVAAALGTVAGHVLSYGLGRRYGAAIAEWAPVRWQPRVFAAAQEMLANKGARGLVRAHFVPRLRTLVPAVAGVEGMALPRFLLIDGLSGVAWAGLHVFGAGLLAAVLAETSGRLAVVLVAGLIAFALALWLARLAASLTLAWADRTRRTVHRWVAARDGRAARLLASTLDPDDLTGLLVVLWGAIVFVALYIFAELAGDVWQGADIVTADLALNRFVQFIRTPSLDTAMVVITMLGDAVVLAAVVAASLAWLLFRRAWWTAGAFAAAVLTPLASVPLVKGILARERPLVDLYSGVESFSFPSGHATNSMVVLGTLAVLICNPLAGRRRWILVGVIAVLPLAIALSRIYLQAHWPSDVAAGLAFALAIVAGFILALGWLPAADYGAKGLALVAGATLLVAGGANIASHLGEARLVYAPHPIALPMSAEAWQDGGWRTVDRGRVDFEGDVETPFFLQWIGDRGALDAALAADGWSPSPPWDLAALSLFVGAGNARELPTMPKLHLGRFPDATWIKPTGGDTRDVFRLWQSPHTVAGEPLYVGAAEAETIMRVLGIVTLIDDRALAPAQTADLRQAIAAAAPTDRYRFWLDNPPTDDD